MVNKRKINKSKINWALIISIIAIGVAIIGGIPGVITFLDSYVPPEVVIDSVTPVYVSETIDSNSFGELFSYSSGSLYFLVDVRSKGRPVEISGLEIIGQMFLNPTECRLHMLHPAYAKAWTIDEIDAYCSKNNLYFDTKFKAWKADDKLKTLDKFSVELFEFALFENSIEDSRTCGWRNPIDLYFGSYDLNLKPTLKNTCPQKSFVFDTDYRGNFSNSFRKDYFDGNLNFNLIAGGREIEIPMDSFRPLVIISKQAWDSENHEHIIYNET